LREEFILKKVIVIGITLLFFVISISPIIFGNSIQKTIPLMYSGITKKDKFDISEELLNRDIICYGYCLNDSSGQLVEGPVYFSLNNPGNISQIWETTSPAPMAGGAWTWSGWYCSEYGNGKLWKIDYDSGYMVEIGGGGVHLNGLSYDGISNNLVGSSNTSLYMVDEESGEQTLIGLFDLPEGSKMGGIAFDSESNCYGIEYVNNDLYLIDSDTGETEYIGSLGIDINGNAFLDYCVEEDCLYLSTYTDKGRLYKLDQYTGVCSFIGEFQGGAEISAFIIDPLRFYLPNANFTWSPQNPQTGDTIEFNASSSYSKIGEIILYEWDWNNDLIFDVNSESPLTEYMWEETGYYPVTLLVWDDNNNMDTEQYIVHVGKTLYVGGSGPNNYTKIQDAIDDASDGDTIFVFNGTYYETIIVNKSINLIGENRNSTFIRNWNWDGIVNIVTDWVNISGFTFREGYCGIRINANYNTISNINISLFYGYYGIYLTNFSKCNNILRNNILNNNIYNDYLYGIWLDSSNNNTIMDNIISLNGTYGIKLEDSANNTISNNNITWTQQGIAVSSSDYNIIINNNFKNNDHDIGLYSSNNNNLSCNTFADTHCCQSIGIRNSNNNYVNNNMLINAGGDGINIVDNSYNNTISGNIIIRSKWFHRSGIQVWVSSSYNTIINNTISNNEYGIYIKEFSNNNSIYHNNFINNTENAYDECNNTWDDGYPSGGNYWDDYTGEDTDGDGIGDSPYQIPGGDNEDEYPFMKSFGWNNTRPNQPVITGPINGRKRVWYEYNFSISDPNNDSLWIHIDWEHGTPSKWDGPFSSGSIVKYNYSWRKKGSYTIRAQTMDNNGLYSEWGILEVTIPRTRASSSWYHLFLDRFPILAKLFSFFDRVYI